LTAQRGQAEVRCQMMNANLWPKELSEREESPTHQQQHGGAQRRRWGHGGGTPAIAKWPISIYRRPRL